MGSVQSALGHVANGFSLIGFCVPGFTSMRDIHRAGSVGQRSSLVYSLSLVNCGALVLYGDVLRRNPDHHLWGWLLIAVNATGVVMQTSYIIVYLSHAEAQFFPLMYLGVSSAFFSFGIAAYAMESVFSLRFFCALAGAFESIAPMLNLPTVWRTMSLDSMPHVVSAGVSLTAAIFWMLHSFVGRTAFDWFIAGPALVGILCNSLQVILRILFCFRNEQHGDNDYVELSDEEAANDGRGRNNDDDGNSSVGDTDNDGVVLSPDLGPRPGNGSGSTSGVGLSNSEQASSTSGEEQDSDVDADAKKKP